MSFKEYNMDLDWKFQIDQSTQKQIKGHSAVYTATKNGNASGSAGKEFADRDWESVNLPHDYFTSADINPDSSRVHGYRERNNAWYRKSFVLDESSNGKTLQLVFEGIAGLATIYFNGFLIGKTDSTYCEYVYDITDLAYCDGRLNVISVYIDGNSFEGWWYEGAGIYRHVRLLEKELTSIAHNGIYVKPVLKSNTDNDWNVELEISVENRYYNDSIVYATADICLLDKCIASGKTESVTVVAGENCTIKTNICVKNPLRWDIESPNLYNVRVSLYDGDTVLQTSNVRTGFRTIYVDANKGFFLNGRKVYIKGSCNHQDHACVGVALPDSLHRWRIERIMEFGANAYRCAHNMPAKEILDACDELGVLVMDETRHFGCDKTSLWQLECMLRRDRNHPSIVFWSLLNEEPLQSTEEGARVYRRMKQALLKFDDTRLTTGCINGPLEGTALEMDIAGLNYALSRADTAHEKYPQMAIMGSENICTISTRGCYVSDKDNKHILNNYDEERCGWGSTARNMWRFARERDYYAGYFVWSGFDYRGEPTPFEWPSVSSQFGLMDTCGFEKDGFYYNKAIFTEKPLVHLLPHWNWKEGDTVRVVAVTNCDEVELFLNGRSLGKKAADRCDQPEWQVLFESGVISVKAYNSGTCVAEDYRQTAGDPYKIVLTSNYNTIDNSGQGSVLVNAAVVDRNGVLVPDACNLITFNVMGDGRVLGCGNGDPNSHEIDALPYRFAFNGLCQTAIMADEGAKSLRVKAESDGLLSGEVEITIKNVAIPNYMRSTLGNFIGGFSVSEISNNRPDVNVQVADNDMNTFSPFIIPPKGYQKDFKCGWCIYRTIQELPECDGDSYTLKFANIKGDSIEVYIDGVLCTETSLSTGGELNVQFSSVQKESIEIRILVYGQKDNDGYGLSKYVTLSANK